MVEVVGIGTCALDIVFKTLKTSVKDVLLASNFMLSAGGIVGNTLSGLARLGVNVGYIGKLGDDVWARKLLAAFLRDGVNFSKIQLSKGDKTEAVAVAVDERGERSFIVFLGAILKLKPEDIDLGYVKSASYLITDGIPLETTLHVVKEVKKFGVKVFFSPAAPPSLYEEVLEGSKQDFMELLTLSDVFSTNHLIALAIANCPSINEAIKELRKLNQSAHMALTMGEKGCVICYNDVVEEVAAFKVDVVDTTGAGDAFNAGLLYGLLRNLSFRESAIIGNALAAIKCTKLGARSGLPDLPQLKDFLRSRGFEVLANIL